MEINHFVFGGQHTWPNGTVMRIAGILIIRWIESVGLWGWMARIAERATLSQIVFIVLVCVCCTWSWEEGILAKIHMKAHQLCLYFKRRVSNNTIVQHLLLVLRSAQPSCKVLSSCQVHHISSPSSMHVDWPYIWSATISRGSFRSLLRSHQAVYPVRLGVAMNSTRMPSESLGTLWVSNFAICEVDNIITQINSCLNHVPPTLPYMTTTLAFICIYWQ